MKQLIAVQPERTVRASPVLAPSTGSLTISRPAPLGHLTHRIEPSLFNMPIGSKSVVFRLEFHTAGEAAAFAHAFDADSRAA